MIITRKRALSIILLGFFLGTTFSGYYDGMFFTAKAEDTASLQISCFEFEGDSLVADTIIVYDGSWAVFDRVSDQQQASFENIPAGTYHIDIYEWNMLVAYEVGITISPGESKNIEITACQRKDIDVFAYYNDHATSYPNASVKLESYNGEFHNWDIEVEEPLGSDGKMTIKAYPSNPETQNYSITIYETANPTNVLSSEIFQLISYKRVSGDHQDDPPNVEPGQLQINCYEHDGTEELEADTIVLYNSDYGYLKRAYNESEYIFTDLYPRLYTIEIYEMNQLVATKGNVEIEEGLTTNININANQRKVLDIYVRYNNNETPYADASVVIESLNGEFDRWKTEFDVMVNTYGHVNFWLFPTTLDEEKYRLNVYKTENNEQILDQREFTISSSKTMYVTIDKSSCEIINVNYDPLQGGIENEISVIVKNNGETDDFWVYLIPPDYKTWNVLQQAQKKTIPANGETIFNFTIIPYYKGDEGVITIKLRDSMYGEPLDLKEIDVTADHIPLHYDKIQAEIGFDFIIPYESDTLIDGDFEFSIFLKDTISKVNPGQVFEINVGYTDDESTIDFYLPDSIYGSLQSFIDKIDYSKYIDNKVADYVLSFFEDSYASSLINFLTDLSDDGKLNVATFDSFMGKQWIPVYEIDIKNCFSGIANKALDAALKEGNQVFYIGLDGDVTGDIYCEGPADSYQEDISFVKDKKITFKVDGNAKPGEEINIALVPVYNGLLNLSTQTNCKIDIPVVYPNKDFSTSKIKIFPTDETNMPFGINPTADDDVIGFTCTINYPPTAGIVGDGFTGFTDETITFDASDSSDQDGEILTYQWDFGDGSTGFGKIKSHHYSKPGEYTVKLTVTDDTYANDTMVSAAVIAQANRPPTDPVISGEAELEAGKDYSFTIVSDDLDGDHISYDIDWGDEEFITTDFVTNGTIVMLNHSWPIAGKYEIKVRCYDNQTYSASSLLTVYVDAKSITGMLNGLLLDENGDGIYDSFLNTVKNTKFPIEQADDGSYQIDANGDGTWDYTFDLFKGLDKIEITDEITNTPGFSLILIMIAIMFIVSFSKRK